MNNAYSRGNYPNYHPTIIQLSQNQQVCEALSLSLLKCSPEIHPLAPTNYPELRHWAPRVAVGFLSFEGFFEIPMRKNLMIHDDHGILMILMILMILELLHVASCPWLKNTTFNKSQTFISFCFYVYRVGWQPATRAPEESMQLTMKQLRDNKKSWNSQPFQHLSLNVSPKVL